MYYRRSFTTRDSAKRAVVEFVEAYYNRRRPHSTIGYKVPAEAMAAFFERTAPSLEQRGRQARQQGALPDRGDEDVV